ncbi:MAG: hypothetical protein ACRDCE_22820 [Cetobacterium sp.]|uniref:hypothetical protein n=1 Tax=Cetobacterium sp. TaxID=2071632 RepID=UPI003EE624C8
MSIIKSLTSQDTAVHKHGINQLFDTDLPYRRIEKVIKISNQYRDVEAGRNPSTPIYPPRNQAELLSDIEALIRKFI